MSRRTGTPSRIREMLDRWDKGKKHRKQVLKSFLDEYQGLSEVIIEDKLDQAASLLLARIITSLRLQFMDPSSPIALHLKAISIFISAGTSRRYLDELVDSGCVLTILEIVGVRVAYDEDVKQGLLLLQRIASAGQRYKALICQNSGLKIIANCLEHAKSEQTLDFGRLVLTELVTLNPAYAGHIHETLLGLLQSPSNGACRTACLLIRNLHTTVAPNTPGDSEFIAAAINSLKCSNLQVQYECQELLLVLATHDDLRDDVACGVVQTLVPTREEIYIEDVEEEDEEIASNVAQFLHITEAKRIPPALRAQGAAAKLATTVFESDDELARMLMGAGVVPGLLFCIGTEEAKHGRRLGAVALKVLATRYPTVEVKLREQLGDETYNAMVNDVDVFVAEMTSEEANRMREYVEFE